MRQGDSLSPILFNMVADCLTRIVHTAQQNMMIVVLIEHIIPNGVAILQYADDTIVCLKHDIQSAVHLKFLLYLYGIMSGLKINFNKSEVLMINDEESLGQTYAEILNCQIGSFPIKNLGVPVSPSRLHISDWSHLVEKSNKKLDVWKGGNMPIAGRTTLIGASLNNSPIYRMLVNLLPKTTIECLDKNQKKFFFGKVGVLKKVSFSQMGKRYVRVRGKVVWELKI